MDNLQVGGFNNLNQLDTETMDKIKQEYNKGNFQKYNPNAGFNSNFLASESAQLKKEQEEAINNSMDKKSEYS